VLWGEGTTDEMCLGVLQVGAGVATNATHTPWAVKDAVEQVPAPSRLLECPLQHL